MATATGQPTSEGSWTSKEALLAQLASLQRVIQLQDATCENRSPADLSWRHEAVKLSVEKQAIQDECLEMARHQHQCEMARSTIAGLIHSHSNACIKEFHQSTSGALDRLWHRLSAVEMAHSRASGEIMYYQERTREHVVKVESKLIELAEESDDAQRRLKVSQREAKALAKENDRLTKMVAQMHAAIVESRASLESCERRAFAAESLAAKLAGDRTGSDKLTHTDVSSSMRDATPRADSPPERAAVETSNGDDHEALSCVVGSDKHSGSTIARLISELRELEGEARSLLASQELDVTELVQQRKTN